LGGKSIELSLEEMRVFWQNIYILNF
jgi:hypothetical protein